MLDVSTTAISGTPSQPDHVFATTGLYIGPLKSNVRDHSDDLNLELFEAFTTVPGDGQLWQECTSLLFTAPDQMTQTLLTDLGDYASLGNVSTVRSVTQDD